MKVAVFSDIHGNLQALEAIINDINKEKIDKVICLGDVIGIGPNPKECLDMIIDNNIDMVLGNHELYYVYGVEIDDAIKDKLKAHYEWINRQLNKKYLEFLKNKGLEIKIDNILFTHFLINQDRKEFYPFYELSILKDNEIKNIVASIKYEKIFVGHEHTLFNIETNLNELIGIGSSGCVKDDSTSYIIIDLKEPLKIERRSIKYDRANFINNLKRIEYPDREMISEFFFGVKM